MIVSVTDVLNILLSLSNKKKGGLVKFLLKSRAYKLKQIAAEAEQDLRDIFQTQVRLRINVEEADKPDAKKKRIRKRK